MRIEFKSTPTNWKKEYSGLKSNTGRVFDDEKDNRLEIIEKYLIEGKLIIVIN